MSQAQYTNASLYSDCICLPGTTGQQTCSPCPQGSWCPGNGVQNPCPANSSSPANSSTQDQCTCLPGYMPNNGSAGNGTVTAAGCKLCPVNETCLSGIASPCKPFSQTLTEGQTQCICMPGFYSNQTAASSPCLICPPNYYCSGNTSIAACPGNSTAPKGQYSSAACSCNPGFLQKAQACTQCPQGFYCPGGSAQAFACPAYSFSLALAFSVTQCICLPGYYALTTISCAACPSGTYAPMSNTSACRFCQPGTYTPLASASTLCLNCVQGSFSTTQGAPT